MAAPDKPGKIGRPRREAGPKMPYIEVDQLLVEGELVDGVRVWPSQRVLAKRYGVSPSLIANFASQHECLRRRAELVAGKPAQSLTESVADKAATPEPPAEQPVPTPAPEDTQAPAPERHKRKPGRPRKAEAPLIPYEELDRLLVFGEARQLESGSTTTVYMSHRALAERYGVVTSVIGDYARSHNCTRRREEAKTRISARTDEKLIEARATAIAVTKDDAIRMIDGYLVNFEKALEEGRVRFDNPTDFNTMVRLKEYVLGGADSRQEIHAALSLESLQQRHARMLREVHETTPELSGVVDVRSAGSDQAPAAHFPEGRSLPQPTPLTSSSPLPLTFDDSLQEPTAAGAEEPEVAADVGSTGATEGEP